MSRLLTLPLTALLVVALAGCVPTKAVDVAPSRTATVQATSGQQTFGRAVEVYTGFIAIGDVVGIEGGVDADRLAEFSGGDLLDGSVEGLSQWPLNGWRQTGHSTGRDFVLVDYKRKPELEVVIELCEDISDVDVVEGSGESIVPPERQDTLHFRAHFEVVGGHLKLTSRELLDYDAC